MIYQIDEFEIELDVSGVFVPPKEPISRHFDVQPQETMIDIGTGSGILAILGAKRGARVYATDNDYNAVKTARKNAALNRVSIDIEEGDYFGPYKGAFDVIVSNIAQTWLPNKNSHLNGGKKGIEHILNILTSAQDHMHETSRLYLNVYSVSDYTTTLRYMYDHFSVELLCIKPEPIKQEVLDNLSWYENKPVGIYALNEKVMANQFFYKLNKFK